MFDGLLGEALYAAELCRMGIAPEVAAHAARQFVLSRAAEAAGIRPDFGPGVIQVDFISKRKI